MVVKDRSVIWDTILDVAGDSQRILNRVSRLHQYDASKYAESLDSIADRVNRPFKLGILGEFRSGKSSLINVVAGMEIALTDERETTATINCYSYGAKASTTIYFTDGSTKEFSITDANMLLDERRHDHDWLNTVDHVQFFAPCEILRRMEFWDSPGFAGSEHNEKLANSFAHQVDAVIWVFNCDYLGKSNLASTLEDLSQRGKRIIAVVNKCEERTEDDFPVINSLVTQTYRTVPFVDTIPISTWMAREYQQGVAESQYFGDLPADGGLARFLEIIEREILNDPTRLSAESAAGDLRSVLISLHDEIHHDVLRTRRDLGLIDHMRQENRNKVKEHIGKYIDKISVDVARVLSQRWSSTIRDSLSKASVEHLRDEEWLNSLINTATSDEVYNMRICSEYIAGQGDSLYLVLEELGIKQNEYLDKLLTPLDALRTKITSMTEGGISREDWTSSDKSGVNWKVVATGSVLAVAAIVAVATGVGPLAILLGGASAGTFAFTRTSESLSEDELRRVRENDCLSRIRRTDKETKKKVHDYLSDRFQEDEDKYVELLVREHEELIMGSRNRNEMDEENRELEICVDELDQLVTELELAARIPPRTTNMLLNKQLNIRRDDRAQTRLIIDAIFAEAQRFLEITDSDFSYRMFDELITINEKIPLRLITWKEPLLPGIAEEFQMRMQELRTRRSGAVSVVTPKPFPGVDSSVLPSGCWFFTECRAYHFNASFADVLVASRDLTFTPFSNDYEVHPSNFDRWWKADVDGFLCMQLA